MGGRVYKRNKETWKGKYVGKYWLFKAILVMAFGDQVICRIKTHDSNNTKYGSL